MSCSKWPRSCIPISLHIAVRSNRVLFNRISSIIHSNRVGALSQINASIKWICLKWKNFHWDLKYDFGNFWGPILSISGGKVKLETFLPAVLKKIRVQGREGFKQPEWGCQYRWGSLTLGTTGRGHGKVPCRPSRPSWGTRVGKPKGRTHLWRREASWKRSKLSCLTKAALKWTLLG